MNIIPNISGIGSIGQKTRAKKVARIRVPANRAVYNENNSKFIEDVDLLVTDYNDKAFMYGSGKVDIIKDGVTKTVNFGSKKDAALYLMKAGWKYV